MIVPSDNKNILLIVMLEVTAWPGKDSTRERNMWVLYWQIYTKLHHLLFIPRYPIKYLYILEDQETTSVPILCLSVINEEMLHIPMLSTLSYLGDGELYMFY
jgi:hypothetical protein